MLNHALWSDNAEMMPDAVVVVRALNRLCVTRLADPADLRFPPGDVCYRGGRWQLAGRPSV